MITSLIEMLEVPKFGCTTTSTIYFKLCDKILFETSWAESMRS